MERASSALAFLIDNAGSMLLARTTKTDAPACGMQRQSCVDARACDHPARDTIGMDKSWAVSSADEQRGRHELGLQPAAPPASAPWSRPFKGSIIVNVQPALPSEATFSARARF